MSKKFIIGIVVVLFLAFFFYSKTQSNSPSNEVSPIPTSTISTSELPGIQTGDYPWNSNLDTLEERLKAINSPLLTSEGNVLHTHQHINIFISGKEVSIPANIGVDKNEKFISVIHTHDTDQIIHVEAPFKRDFTLGEFFDVWGVKFTKDCIGGYCVNKNNKLEVYLNGVLSNKDNPRDILLESHQQITIIYGTPLPSPIPSTYIFPKGY